MKVLLILSAALILSCGRDPRFPAREMLSNGNADRGRALMQQYGCPSCHVIPGVKGASGHVGPPLNEIALRTYLAGRILNTPEGLMRGHWEMNDLRSIDRRTLKFSDGQAEQMRQVILSDDPAPPMNARRSGP